MNAPSPAHAIVAESEHMQQNRTRDIISYANVRIEVIAEGSGPLVVMLPSRSRDSEDFDAVASLVAAQQFRVLRPQPRGIGKSSGPMTDISLHDYARDVAAVIERQGNGPAIMVGHAFGSWICRMTAVDYPSLVRGVVIAAAAASGPTPNALAVAQAKASDTSLPDAERLKALEFAFFAPGHDASSWLTGWHKEAGDAQGDAIRRTNQDEWWPAGTAPLLDLQGERDPWRPPNTTDQIKDEFGRRVTVAVLGNASHALIPEQPDGFAGRIVSWARALP